MDDTDQNKPLIENNDSCKDLFNKIINTKTNTPETRHDDELVDKLKFQTYTQDSNRLLQ